MTDLGWFSVFALLLVLMVALSAWMSWYSRRAMRTHKDQIEGMIREMKGVIDQNADAAPQRPLAGGGDAAERGDGER